MLLRFLLVIALLATASCEGPKVASQQFSATSTPIPKPSTEPSPSRATAAPIHKIDFENFTYAAAPVYSNKDRSFTLKDGKYSGRMQNGGIGPEPVYHVDTIYGDVTGDRVDDAIVVLTVSIRGTAIPYYVYIYAIERDKPKLLWAFETGDRADGGLRRAFPDNGNLVVDLYGTNTYVGGDYYSSNEDGSCCPSHYTRSRYQWAQSHFAQMGQLQVFSNVGGAPYLPLVERGLRDAR